MINNESKLFVGNLSDAVSETSLNEFFSEVGSVKSVKIIIDNFTGRSRGFGFVEMETKEEASGAIDKLNNKECGGRTLRIDWAKSKETQPSGNRTFNGRARNDLR